VSFLEQTAARRGRAAPLAVLYVVETKSSFRVTGSADPIRRWWCLMRPREQSCTQMQLVAEHPHP